MTEGIETKRLFLRSPCPTDAGAIAAGLGNFNVTRFLTRVPFPYAESDAVDWLSLVEAKKPEQREFVIEHAGDGVIGVIGFDSELGYWLAEPFWGRGLMTEAGAAALRWYFSTTDAQSIASGAHEDNPASLRVQHKLGFEVVGSEVRHSVSRGTDILHVVTSLTRESFAQKGYLS
jgi:RimJ/RimL family protein N-acetyltransferase